MVMNKILVAKTLLKLADILDAKYEYRHNPDHKNRPSCGGCEKTDRGWSRNDNPSRQMVIKTDFDSEYLESPP